MVYIACIHLEPLLWFLMAEGDEERTQLAVGVVPAHKLLQVGRLFASVAHHGNVPGRGRALVELLRRCEGHTAGPALRLRPPLLSLTGLR